MMAFRSRRRERERERERVQAAGLKPTALGNIFNFFAPMLGLVDVYYILLVKNLQVKGKERTIFCQP
jgi:hypothetical protein